MRKIGFLIGERTVKIKKYDFCYYCNILKTMVEYRQSTNKWRFEMKKSELSELMSNYNRLKAFTRRIGGDTRRVDRAFGLCQK